ncbi:VOC family protein [Pleomorphomonas sp. JP5]|uniref:VOC family protein n=1 Tax=Pleomorphomonas sp. JP5 TaxID=2942998 RepID=UPI002043A444|nr:VOC family protein [Pleomorphomonas sp. JP5]MCM5557726.1 VOC family protein [Pleomorphomonas sp. JP5]
MADDQKHFRAVSSITFGVADLPRARAFYDALGFVADPASNDEYVIYALENLKLSLFPRALLAKDAEVADDGHGFDGITFAHDYPSAEAVDAAMSHALAAGAVLRRPARTVFWGGYSAFVADPDGHLWELVYNPFL